MKLYSIIICCLLMGCSDSSLENKEQNKEEVIVIDEYTLSAEEELLSTEEKSMKSAEFAMAGLDKHNEKKYVEAIVIYIKAIAFDPNNSINYNWRGNSMVALGDYDKAIKDYSKSIELTLPGGNEYGYSGRAYAKLLKSDFEGAIKDYSLAIFYNEDEVYFFNRGLAKYYLKDYVGSIEDCTKAIELNEHNIDAYGIRADSKFELGDKSGACLDWKYAKSQNHKEDLEREKYCK